MPGRIGYLLINGVQDHPLLGTMRLKEMTLLFLMSMLVCRRLMPMEIGFGEMEHMQYRETKKQCAPCQHPCTSTLHAHMIPPSFVESFPVRQLGR